jgi:regulatory protein
MTSLFEKAIGYLSDRNLSEKELRSLLEKEFAAMPNLDKGIDTVFLRLNELHLLDDARLARHLAAHYSHKGNQFIQRTLEHKGINATIIEQALSSLADEPSRALEEVRDQLRMNPHKSQEELCRFLKGRHFSMDSINHAVLKAQKSPYVLKHWSTAA